MAKLLPTKIIRIEFFEIRLINKANIPIKIRFAITLQCLLITLSPFPSFSISVEKKSSTKRFINISGNKQIFQLMKFFINCGAIWFISVCLEHSTAKILYLLLIWVVRRNTLKLIMDGKKTLSEKWLIFWPFFNEQHNLQAIQKFHGIPKTNHQWNWDKRYPEWKRIPINLFDGILKGQKRLKLWIINFLLKIGVNMHHGNRKHQQIVSFISFYFIFYGFCSFWFFFFFFRKIALCIVSDENQLKISKELRKSLSELSKGTHAFIRNHDTLATRAEYLQYTDFIRNREKPNCEKPNPKDS